MRKAKRIWRFSKAAISHVCKGMPTCNQEQINERLSICKGCKHFNNGSCRKCGCNCNNNKKFLNKLAWADQQCPIGKWKKVEPTPEKPQEE